MIIMRTIFIWLFFWSICFPAYGGDKPQWFCTDESGKRQGRVIWACGVGESIDEASARRQALNNAIEEFKTICELSSDCNGKKKVVEPKRLTCVESFGGRLVKCYRLIGVTLSRDSEVFLANEGED